MFLRLPTLVVDNSLLGWANGLVAPDAVYFTSHGDGICWLRVTNQGSSAMEFDSAGELFTGQVLTSEALCRENAKELEKTRRS